MDERSQLCVLVGDRVVVDLWGFSLDTAAIGHRSYTGDTLTNVFSSTKVGLKTWISSKYSVNSVLLYEGYSLGHRSS